MAILDNIRGLFKRGDKKVSVKIILVSEVF